MNTVKILALCVTCSFFTLSAYAQEPKMLKVEEPVILKAIQAQPYEITPGTAIPLAILSADELLPIAQVTMDVYDSFGNVTIPRGSRLVGKYVENKKGRHFIQWTGLQIPAVAGTLKFDPPLMASMRNGSFGLAEFTSGSLACAVTHEPFLVPH